MQISHVHHGVAPKHRRHQRHGRVVTIRPALLRGALGRRRLRDGAPVPPPHRLRLRAPRREVDHAVSLALPGCLRTAFEERDPPIRGQRIPLDAAPRRRLARRRFTLVAALAERLARRFGDGRKAGRAGALIELGGDADALGPGRDLSLIDRAVKVNARPHRHQVKRAEMPRLGQHEVRHGAVGMKMRVAGHLDAVQLGRDLARLRIGAHHLDGRPRVEVLEADPGHVARLARALAGMAAADDADVVRDVAKRRVHRISMHLQHARALGLRRRHRPSQAQRLGRVERQIDVADPARGRCAVRYQLGTIGAATGEDVRHLLDARRGGRVQAQRRREARVHVPPQHRPRHAVHPTPRVVVRCRQRLGGETAFHQVFSHRAGRLWTRRGSLAEGQHRRGASGSARRRAGRQPRLMPRLRYAAGSPSGP